jgi:hypothetical protein
MHSKYVTVLNVFFAVLKIFETMSTWPPITAELVIASALSSAGTSKSEEASGNGATTFGIMIFRIMAFSIMTFVGKVHPF